MSSGLSKPSVAEHVYSHENLLSSARGERMPHHAGGDRIWTTVKQEHRAATTRRFAR